MKPPTTRDVFRLKGPTRKVYTAMAMKAPMPPLSEQEIAFAVRELIRIGLIQPVVVDDKDGFAVYIPS